MARKPRHRLRYTFWLNHLDKDEDLVADTIEKLKSERSFAQTVRDGIMIVAELRQGRADLLFKLYPWVADLVRPPQPIQSNSDLERQIADLKRIILEQGSVSTLAAYNPPTKPALGELKKLALPVIDDDDDDTVVLNKTTNTNIMDNFFASFAKLGS